MTLDDGYVSMREAMRRQEDTDRALAEAEWQEQRLLESVEAEEQKWVGIFAAMPQHVRDIRYSGDAS